MDEGTYKLFLSSYFKETVDLPHSRVKTFTSSASFLWGLFTRLPFLLLKIIFLRITGTFRAAYFPFFHHWSLPIILLCKILRIKIIFTVHDGLIHLGDGRKLDQWWQNACIKLADELIFLTEFVKKQTIENVGFKGGASVSPHGVNTPDGLQVEARQHTAKPRLLFLGRVVKYKGVEMLLEAVRLLEKDDYECLTIAGELRYPLNLPKDSKIKLIDEFLPEKEMIRLLNEHDILVLPYLEATQSGIIAFGIATGIPMICTNVGGLAEQVKPNQGAIFVKPNVESLKEGIRRLANSPDLYLKLHQHLLAQQGEDLWVQNAQLVALLSSNG